MLEYVYSQYGKLGLAFAEHLWMVGAALLLSLALAALLTMLSTQIETFGTFLTNAFSVVYSIPSLALFALLIPVTGLGKATAVIVLVLYNQYVLLRNFLTALSGVDPSVVEAATGMGMTKLQVLYRVRLPLSRKTMFAGIRLAAVSTIGIATIAAAINAGGLGSILFDGLRTVNTNKIVCGAVLSAALAIGVNWLLQWIESRMEE